MAQYPSKVQRLRAIQETTFGTEASLGSFFEVPIRQGSASLKVSAPVESPDHIRQYMDGRPEGVLMPRSAILEFSVNLETFTTKAGSTVAATNGWLGQMLEAALGGKSIGTGTTVAGAGATVTVVPLTTHTSLHSGCAIGFATGAGGALECREIKSKSGGDHTLKLALTGAPANGSTCYGAASYFADPYMTGSSAKSLQFFAEGMNPNDRWLLLGGGLESLTLETGPGTIPQAKFSWKFAQFLYADASGAPLGTATIDTTGDTLGLATYTNVNTLVVKDSEFRSQTNGTTTLSGSLIHASVIEYKPNVSWVAHKTPGGIQTVKQWVRTHNPPVISGSFVIPYEDNTWFTARDTLLDKMMSYQIGSSATTGAILISAPTCQITDVQQEDIDGIIGLRVSWEGRNDSDVTAVSGQEPVAHSAFRIHLL